MRPATPPRKPLATTGIATFETARSTIHLWLCAGDEGGQAVDTAGIGNDGLRLVQRLRLGLRLRLILRLRTVVALAMLARLLVLALIGLVVTLLIITLLVVTLLVIALAVARKILLLRLRDETRLLAEIREILAIVLAVVAAGAEGSSPRGC